jgi:L-fucose mutarotase
MLKGLHPLLTPDLLWVLAAMGHGDDLAIVDHNHPAHSIARATPSQRLIALPGTTLAEAAAAVLTLLPLDDFTPDAVRTMAVVGDTAAVPPPVSELRIAMKSAGVTLPTVALERDAFYAQARRAFAVVQCGDTRFYANALLRKGAIAA